jgi:hemerythrin
MTTPAFTDALRTGIPGIDAYHERLFHLVDGLCLASQDGAERALLGDFIDRLLAQTLAHFAEEEAEMRASAYPDLERHRQAHHAFADEVATILRDANDGRMIVLPEALDLARRLIGHVMVHDQPLAAHLRQTLPAHA